MFCPRDMEIKKGNGNDKNCSSDLDCRRRRDGGSRHGLGRRPRARCRLCAAGAGAEACTAGLGVGYRFSELFRSDLTVDWTGDYGNADATTVMGNGYIDFVFGGFLRPYIGAGIGWGDVDQPGGSDDGLALAAHA